MKHAHKQRTLGRVRNQRTALLRGLAISLIDKGQIKTTLARAKELRPFAERLVTYGKCGTIAARRNASANLGDPSDVILRKLFAEIAPKMKDRQGGYTRIIKMGLTKAGREEAVIEFVE